MAVSVCVSPAGVAAGRPEPRGRRPRTAGAPRTSPPAGAPLCYIWHVTSQPCPRDTLIQVVQLGDIQSMYTYEHTHKQYVKTKKRKKMGW